jgi:Protein of unknown function (DUF3040)
VTDPAAGHRPGTPSWDALSGPEREALADLRDELQRSDPELAGSLARLGVPRGLRLGLALGGGLAALLLLGALAGPGALGVAGIGLAVAGPLLVALALPPGGRPGEDLVRPGG